MYMQGLETNETGDIQARTLGTIPQSPPRICVGVPVFGEGMLSNRGGLSLSGGHCMSRPRSPLVLMEASTTD
jgi:hypothetical protein